MNLIEESEIEYPRTVRVTRPATVYSESGTPVESETTVIESMTADIQLSLKVRRLVSENATGASDDAMWVMYCNPPVAISSGDRVYDDTGRVFAVESAADWGSHVECTMKER